MRQDARMVLGEEPRARALTPEQLDDLIDLWHEGAGPGLGLHEFLGWSEAQYSRYVQRGVIPDFQDYEDQARSQF